MQLGNIVKLFYDKEYGSIRTQGGEAVHFHKNCLWGVKFDELTEGQAVEFETQITRNGLLGFEVRPAKPSTFCHTDHLRIKKLRSRRVLLVGQSGRSRKSEVVDE